MSDFGHGHKTRDRGQPNRLKLYSIGFEDVTYDDHIALIVEGSA